MNPKIQALIVRAQGAFLGQPPLGRSVRVDFGDDGNIYVSSTNQVLDGARVVSPADCTIKLSLDTLASLESGDLFPLIDGEVEIDGDRDLAKTFGSIVKAAA
jgi:hypothetical protein